MERPSFLQRAGPQKEKNGVGHLFYTFHKGLFLVIKTRAIIALYTILKIDVFRGQIFDLEFSVLVQTFHA